MNDWFIAWINILLLLGKYFCDFRTHTFNNTLSVENISLNLAAPNLECQPLLPTSIQCWVEGLNLCKMVNKRKTDMNIRNKEGQLSLFRDDLIVNIDYLMESEKKKTTQIIKWS